MEKTKETLNLLREQLKVLAKLLKSSFNEEETENG